MLVLASLAAPALAADAGLRAAFVGGTLTGIPARSRARLDLTAEDALTFRTAKTQVRIPYRNIGAIEYGQHVSRRYAAAVLISPVLLLSKSRKHFVTIGYTDEQSRQQALVFRVEKGDVRAALAGLQARSGRRVEYQDDEARKGAKD